MHLLSSIHMNFSVIYTIIDEITISNTECGTKKILNKR